jgi:RNA polymerase sigma factor (sigma-70 family)
MKNGVLLDNVSKGQTEPFNKVDPKKFTEAQLVYAWMTEKDKDLFNDYTGELIKRITPLLWKHFWRLNRLGVEYGEFESDILNKFFKGLSGLKEPEKFWKFLETIVNNVISTIIKKQLVMRDRSVDLGGGEGEDEQDDAIAKLNAGKSSFEHEVDTKIMLDQIMFKYRAEFTDTEYEVLKLWREDKSAEEMAKVMGMSVGYVRNLLSKIPRKIRLILKDRGRSGD